MKLSLACLLAVAVDLVSITACPTILLSSVDARSAELNLDSNGVIVGSYEQLNNTPNTELPERDWLELDWPVLA